MLCGPPVPGPTHRGADQRVQKDHADQHAPETAPDRSRGGEVRGLVEINLAVLVLFVRDRGSLGVSRGFHPVFASFSMAFRSL